MDLWDNEILITTLNAEESASSENTLVNMFNDMAILIFYLYGIVGYINEATRKLLKNTQLSMCNTDYKRGYQGEYLRCLDQSEAIA